MPTRDALRARLAPPPARSFLAEAEFAVLSAACARFLPDARIEVAGEIDARLAAGTTDG